MKGLDPFSTTNSLYGNFYGKYAYPMTSYTPDFLHSEMERAFYDKTKQMQQTYFDRYASLRLPNQQMNKQYFENNNDNNNDNNQNLFRQQQKMQPTQFENINDNNNNFNINYKNTRPVSAFPQTQRNINNYYDNNNNLNNFNKENNDNNNNWEKGEVPSYSQLRNKIQTRKKEYYNNSYRRENPQEFINKNEVEPDLHYRVENTYKYPPSVKHMPYGYIPNQEMFQEFRTKRPQSSNKPRINVYKEAFEKNKNYQEQFNNNNINNNKNNIPVRPPSAQINNNNINQQQFMNRPQVRIPTPKNDYNNNYANNVNNNNNYRIPTPKNNNNNVQMYSNPNNLSVNDVYNNIMNPPKQDLCPTYKSYNGPNYHMINSNYHNQNSIQQPSYDPQQMNQYNQQIQQPPIEPQYNNDNYNNNNYSNNDNNYINENNNYNNISNNNYDNINNNNNNYNNIQDNYNNPPPTNDYQNSIAKINQISNNPPKKTQNAYEFLTKVVNSKVGLSNISNISYMTSCLQTLIHCPLFISKFLEEGIPIFKSKSRDTPVAGCLYNLMVDITKSNDFTSISPNIIKNCIQDIHNEFQDNNNEHDCQEFCRYFIQDINTDLNRVTEENKPNNKNENYEGEPNKRYEYELFIKENLSKENSIITDLFFGYLSFEFTCMNCGGKEFSFSQFLDLPLQFESNKNIHLNTLLRKNILKKEIVEMEDKCSLCHKSNEKEQIIKIAKLPNVLMLSLQRNDYENNIKNESVVQFDEIMDLSELIDNDLIYEEENNYRFKLFGVIYFVNGKYISYSFVEDAWFKFNNEEVVRENPELNSNNVYSLFYMKI